jgi:hypothetical protein
MILKDSNSFLSVKDYHHMPEINMRAGPVITKVEKPAEAETRAQLTSARQVNYNKQP